jgi:hypothetical protein
MYISKTFYHLITLFLFSSVPSQGKDFYLTNGRNLSFVWQIHWVHIVELVQLLSPKAWRNSGWTFSKQKNSWLAQFWVWFCMNCAQNCAVLAAVSLSFFSLVKHCQRMKLNKLITVLFRFFLASPLVHFSEILLKIEIDHLVVYPFFL